MYRLYGLGMMRLSHMFGNRYFSEHRKTRAKSSTASPTLIKDSISDICDIPFPMYSGNGCLCLGVSDVFSLSSLQLHNSFCQKYLNYNHYSSFSFSYQWGTTGKGHIFLWFYTNYSCVKCNASYRERLYICICSVCNRPARLHDVFLFTQQTGKQWL